MANERAARGRQDSAGEGLLLATLQGVQGQLVAMDQRFQAGIASLEARADKTEEAVAKITATWKDRLVEKIGAVLLAALSTFAAVRIATPAPEPQRTMIQQSELQVKADLCFKRANGSDAIYVQCMANDVVAPNSPGAREVAETH
jgi:hypothetical protein